VLRDLPIPSPTIETSMIWSRRFENQPAHRWLRENIRSVSKDLRSK
jgi:DNA-binding transcriptional LysR family regulator